MGLRLSVFTTKMMKNYILPSINNSDYTIVLDKDKFGLKNNIILELQVIDHEWSFKRTSVYKLIKNTDGEAFEPIKPSDMFMLRSGGSISVRISVSNAELSFDNLKKYALNPNVRVTIGRSNSNVIQYEMQNFVSKTHAVIENDGRNWVVGDKSRNGIFVDGKRIKQFHILKNGEHIEIYGLRIIFFNNMIAVSMDNHPVINETVLPRYANELGAAAFRKGEEREKQFFHRSPRNIEKIYNESIEIEPPPNLRKPEQRPLLLTVGPSLTMAIPMMLGCGMAIMASRAAGGASSAFMYTGIITAVGSAVIGTIWTLVNLRYSNKKYKETEQKRFDAYGNYLIATADKIRDMYESNVRALNKQYPSAHECCSYDGDSQLLWNRNILHDDMMYYRLGLGEMEFQTEIIIPKEKFKLDNDELEQKPKKIYDEYHILSNVPIGVDLFEHRIVGIVGGENKSNAFEIVKCLSAQIAASNSYTDIKMAFVYNSEHETNEQWKFAKWFPHVWMEEKKGRFIASNRVEASDLFFALTNILRTRNDEDNLFNSDKKEFVRPHYVLFIEDISWLDGEPIAKYINECKAQYGLTTVLMAEKISDLPNRCDYIICDNDEFSGIYDIGSQDGAKTSIAFDKVTAEELEAFSRRLMNIEIAETEVGGEIVSSLDFFEMYGVKSLKDFAVMDRWKKNRTYDSMKALIGKKAGGIDCYLDIHEKYHGPHGLVAGTTGSGKSETLQTYMLSLAINFSPNDIAFFVIDFKGGGMANLFSDLPHGIGQISNLSGNQVHRAMVSIKSENMRRQRIFSENGVNNINNYTKLLKNGEASLPVPHLFIIIDEFAELKKEEPEFMKELISVAQVGRSLGVHLILATQKPSGTVDDNIWSNSKFRLCLRVQDRQDSKDMLHKPDAAYITQAGRGYLQVGSDEVYDYFQSGWSGAVYSENEEDSTSDMVILLGLDGQTAMVGNKTKIQQKAEREKQWLNALLDSFTKAAETVGISLDSYTVNTPSARLVLDETIRIIKDAGYKFDDTSYNRRRIDDFIGLLQEFPQAEGRIEQIIAAAEIQNKRLPEVKEITQLDAIVEYLGNLARENGYGKSMQLWLPVLPQHICLDELDGYKKNTEAYTGYKNNEKWSLEAFIGLSDDPANQAQNPVILDFAQNGHYAICGGIVSGKSTFMQTLVYSLISRYSPEHINLYLLDFSSKMMSAFENAKHVGGVIYENDLDKIEKFFNMLSVIIKERKELFRGGNYAQYTKANGVKLPAVFVCIDNYEGFRSKTALKYDELILRLSSEGVGYGIYMVLTSGGFGTNEIPTSLADNIKSTVSLEMSDKFKYGEILKTMKFDVMPETNISGRGLISVNGTILEFQTALALEAADDYSRLELIKERCGKINELWHGNTARKIPEIPRNPTWEKLRRSDGYEEIINDSHSLPIAYNEYDASIYSVDLRNVYSYLIAGKKKTGKTNFMKNMAAAFKDKDADICIIDSDSRELSAFAAGIGVKYVSSAEELLAYLEELIPEFIKRNKKKKEMVTEGMGEGRIYSEMLKMKRTAIFINDIEYFINMISKSVKSQKYDLPSVMTNLLDKGHTHNIFFVSCVNTDAAKRLAGNSLYSAFAADRVGVLLGGNAMSQNVFDFGSLSFAEQSKAYKPGIGLISADANISRIIIPLFQNTEGDIVA